MKPSVEIGLARLGRQWVGNVLLLGSFLFLFIGLLDAVVAPRYVREFLTVRAVMAAVLLALYGLNRLRTGTGFQFGIMVAVAVLSSVAIEFMVLRLGGAQSTYYAGFIIIVICCLGFVPLSLTQSVILLGLVYAIYLGPIVSIETLTDPVFINNNVFLFSTGIIALALRWQGQKRIISELTLRADLEQKEQELERFAEEMKHQNEELKSFTSIVSHDLRAPLLNIKGFGREVRALAEELGRAAQDCIVPGAPAAARAEAIVQKALPEALGFVDASVIRMDGQINALLKLSRIGRSELKPEPLDMARLVDEILRSLAHQIEEKRAGVTVGALPAVTADRMAMEQIMGNLLDNALKYLDPSRPGRIEVTAGQRDGQVQFQVRDNGRGMAQADIPKAFELFKRVGPQDVPGEGMGLAYVKALVRRQGGRIWCESEPGIGSTFSFTVPAGDRYAAVTPAPFLSPFAGDRPS